MTKQGPKNSKMSTYKTEYVFSLSLGILDCNTEMGNEITFYPAKSWVLLNQLLNRNFRQHLGRYEYRINVTESYNPMSTFLEMPDHHCFASH